MKLTVSITLSKDWNETPINVTVGEELPGGGWADAEERMIVARALQDFTGDARKRAIATLDTLYEASERVRELQVP